MSGALQIQRPPLTGPQDLAGIGDFAATCLKLEVRTYPKPGLVSHIDTGAHADMDAALLERSADCLAPYFTELALAGAAGASMERLRAIGIAAERAMLTATAGINTHRGAIFGLGLLCAAAGFRQAYASGQTLGRVIANRWGSEILAGPQPLHSHGAVAARRYGSGGARREAADGLPSVYGIGLPAIRCGRKMCTRDEEAARVQACMALIAAVGDTNLLHRGGMDGLLFAQEQARHFIDRGGIGAADWRLQATRIHHAFVARRLSPGGCADLLAMTVFADRLET